MTHLAPNKQLGQHWLTDDTVLEAICREAALTVDDVVFEIGPGLGALTRHLARHAGRVIALEFDARLARELVRRPIAPNVQVLRGDIMQFDLTALPPGYKVVANVPYYITSKITRLLLESANPPGLATLLVQKEVAERMAAQPGDMSILAVSVQFYTEPRLGPLVPARLFTPPPEVDSRIITLMRQPQPRFPDVPAAEYFRVVRAGFGEKRKKLRNSLSGGLHLDKPAAEELLAKAGVPAGARAEELSLNDWYNLTKAYLRYDKS
jgi:16S rRNA (adenine1518-N6/adenine1519-N6)-dimethyltransferase